MWVTLTDPWLNIYMNLFYINLILEHFTIPDGEHIWLVNLYVQQFMYTIYKDVCTKCINVQLTVYAQFHFHMPYKISHHIFHASDYCD